MKPTTRVVSFVAATAGLTLAVGLMIGAGCAGTPPTAWEQKFYTVETNSLPRVVVVTNVVPVYLTNLVVTWETNRVSETQVKVVPVTNETHVVTWVTNAVTQTNWVEGYTFTANTNAAALVATARDTGNLFGPWGELASVILGGVIAGYGMLRSSRATKTAGVLAQVIETGRAILQTTPQGQQWDATWKQWMIEHQAESGVFQEVVKLLGNVVDTPSARETAAKLLELMKTK